MNLKILIPFILILAVSCTKKHEKYELQKDRLTIILNDGTLNILPLADGAIRVRMEKDSVKQDEELILVNNSDVPDFDFSDEGDKLQLSTSSITVTFDKQTEVIEFADSVGNVFLREKSGSRKLKPDSVMGEPCFIAEQSFDSPDNEFLFGLGQFQDGHYNLRNVSRKLIQVNSQIAIPFLYSSRGYGILWHQYGLTEFNPADNSIALTKEETSNEGKEVEVTTTSGTQKVSQRQSLYTGKFTVDRDGKYSIMLDLGDMDNRHLVVIDDTAVIDQSNLWLPPAVSALVDLKAGIHSVQVVCRSSNTPKLAWKMTDNTTTFRSPNAKALDYVVFFGQHADDVIASYRNLSGNAPLLPLWAYGFWQCRERYTSASHLINTVTEFRKKKLPMDVIVQDWQYWGSNGWGVPKFDSVNYPNPSGFIKELHDLDAHFAVSIWSNPDKNSDIGKAFLEKGLYIPDTKWLDYFNPETRKRYWNTLNKNLFSHGVDSWWMDATEPENDALKGTMTYLGPGDFYRLTYPLFVSKSVYEGQRESNPEKRVCILTRSAFGGQQRYGVINWSGDIGGTWDSFRRQIVAGLNYSLTGMPYWTTDIGGFFRPGPAQYTDENYQELLTRWFQWGTFNPIFRIHGYQSETEPWKYGDKVEENMRKMMNLRYSLIPYIYSEAWQVTNNGSTMMRPLVMDFPDDRDASGQSYEYMFGHSFLVAPVTEAGISKMQVYLPKNSLWYNFWTQEKISGGSVIEAPTPVDIIPVYVKEGSIVPFGPDVQYSREKTWKNLKIMVYAGEDAAFDLYEDEFDGYDYEKGAHSVIKFSWDDSDKQLTIEERNGEFKNMLESHSFEIVVIDGTGNTPSKKVEYDGEKMVVKL